MVDKQQLNSLALDAQRGNELAMWEIKLQFQSMIHRFSDANRHRMVNQATFEDECFKIIENTVSRYDPEKGDLSQLVVNFIKRRLGQCNKRYIAKSRGATVKELLCSNESEDGFTEYDIEDDLAIVDKDLMYNERITGLAAGDSKKLAILKAWSEPGHSVTATAQELALLFGGKAESHRKSITRFRSDCKKALACAI